MKNNWLTDLFALTCLIGLFFLILLGTRPLNAPDEGRYAEIPREMVVMQDYVTPHLNGIKYFEKPPLLYWIQAGAIKVLGLSEWALRLPTMLLGLLGCLLTYSAARLLYDRRTGWMAGLILGTSMLYYGMAHLITLDMAVTVCITGSLLSFIVGIQYPPGIRRRWFLWGMYVFAGLAVLAKGLIGLLLPGLIIGTWIVLLNQWRILKTAYLLSGLTLFLLVTVPWHVLVQQANPEFFDFYFLEQHFSRYLTMSAGRYQPVWFFLPIVLLGFFPWTIFLGRALAYYFPRSLDAFRAHKDAVFFLLWIFQILIFFSLSKSKLIPYILPIFPALAIVTGRYLSMALDQPKSKHIHSCFQLLPICALAIGATLIALPYFQTVPDVVIANRYIRTMAAILIFGSFITYGLYRWRSLRAALVALIISSMLFLISLVATVPYVEARSVKSLAQVLQPILKPGDEVACYGIYYQDLPFYLRQKVTIVIWLNELTFGLKHQPEAKQWMIDTDTFWQRWESPKRMFMLTSKELYANLDKNSRRKFYILAETKNDLLVSNKLTN